MDINTYRTLVEQRFQTLPDRIGFFNVYRDVYDYVILNSGKRVRSILCLETYMLFSKTNDIEKILDVACAIEIIHAISLVIDDLPYMDDASLRRGKKSAHLEFGSDRAVLMSFGFVLSALEIIRTSGISEATYKLASNAIEEMIHGQIADLHELKLENVSKEYLEFVYAQKTGALFLFAVSSALDRAQLGFETEQAQAMRDFCQHFSLAFQIRDDVIDVTQEQQFLGKDSQIDSRNKKANFVSVLGLDASVQELNNHCASCRYILNKNLIRSEVLETLIHMIETIT